MRIKVVGPIVLMALIQLGAPLPARAQLSSNVQSWMRRLNSGEFSGGPRGGGGGRRGVGRGGGAGEWVDGGAGYTSVTRGGGGT